MKEEKKKDKREIQQPPTRIAEVIPIQGKGEIKSDVDGSYTGITANGEVPVQDVDDL